ncbi:O-antigen ligase family protein [Aeromonas dhakensis]|uniref:O-antigen ligase family protein n=1 Tax=Aeromonas dhakensis TaxID=196024 RepID=UPI002B4969E5|nr:O-antigen ligase family protein [Aeromonas dhakensis]
MYSENIINNKCMYNKKIEKIILGVFSASIFTSKPAIYISSSLFVLYFFYRLLTDVDYREEVWSDYVVVGSLIVFCIGVISRGICFYSLSDITFFSYKSMFLIIFPALVMSLKDKNNRRLALTVSVTGFILSMLYSYVQAFITLPGQWDLIRVGGLWDVSRWAEITAMVFAFMLATMQKNTTTNNRVIRIMFLVMIAVSLLLSGGRAGWVAVIFALIVYVFFLNRKVFICGALSLCLLLVASPYFSGPNNPIMQRVFSITETTPKDYSNYSRLLMWRNGISLIAYNMHHAPGKFIFGMGFENFKSDYIKYLNNTSNVDELKQRTAGNYSLTDLHNSYIDAFNKMGALYAISFYGYIVMILVVFSRGNGFPNSLIVVSPFLIIGFFYTNYIEFQTSMFFFILAMYYASLQSLNLFDSHRY